MTFTNSLLKSFFVLLFTIQIQSVFGQELNCRVVVDDQQIELTDKSVFNDLEQSLSRFLNETKWTNDSYEQYERIFCTFLITITNSPSIGNYNATVQIQSFRPVFNASYETRLLNFGDRDWNFAYTISQPIIFNQNSFTDNLSSLLAYYAYMVIGLDYDSYSPSGGSQYFEIANRIVNNASQQGGGWDQFSDNRNRYWLVNNMISPQFLPYREATYQYHRLGLDVFAENPDEARRNIIEALEKIRDVNNVSPNSVLITSFLDSKRDEIINIFSEGSMEQRRQVYNIMLRLEPSKSSDYTEIIRN
ncbi:type IX secretion system protein PorD [Marinigracilibium pacificum]|uniref:DUF4835 family protein n=1 Tax=Marinigracilibium pacificum TaxID=2729599 RepID=A0A848J3T6_9BACT|nr:DUF4835 family protein [Marinigracilibium pacificum]NMM50175.1 DUF4835 family protein [Marinigracilibium pacificum]